MCSSFIFDLLKIRCSSPWLINYDSQAFYSLTYSYFRQLLNLPQSHPIIFLAENDPFLFLAAFLASVAANSTLFLVNPNWQDYELQQLFNLAYPDFIFGSINYQNYQNTPNHNLTRFNAIMIPTGGSSGNLKFAIHSYQNLTTSVEAFSQYFAEEKVNSFCILPLYHVSGLMQFIRSFFTGGNFAFASYQELKKNLTYPINPQDFFISLVPTQLRYLLDNNPQWLAQFKTVLVGGANTNQDLLDKARNYNINLALTYGMTETASGISILKPHDFLQGNNSNGQILPHSNITIQSQNFSKKLPQKLGIITIQSKSLFNGYYPNQLSSNKTFITDDIGYLDNHGYLHILGRNSTKIITGGENVFPSEVENAIFSTNLVKDVCVVGTPNSQWGEVVTAFYIPKFYHISEATIKKAIATKLSKYKIPKNWHKVTHIPRNAQGKIINLFSDK